MDLLRILGLRHVGGHRARINLLDTCYGVMNMNVIEYWAYLKLLMIMTRFAKYLI